MSESDKQMAGRVLQTLSTARYTRIDAALHEVGPLREQVGSGDGVDGERAAAWLAICALNDTLSEKSLNPNLDARWQRAIDKTAAWLATME